MGKLLPFRRRRSRFDTRWPGDRITMRGLTRDTLGWLGALRPFILGGIALTIWPTLDPALVEPVDFLASAPERIDATFTRCGRGRGHACVIDGDTIKLGSRKVRIIGIDTPEASDPQCAEEARLGERATAELQRLLNEGPFTMVGRSFNDRDRYGRDLRALSRTRPDGTVQSIADDMRESGHARRYLGSARGGWC